MDESGEKEIARISPVGAAARVETRATKIGEVEIYRHTVPVVSTEFGEVKNLPDSQDGVIYVTSIIVVQAVRGLRDDVVAPDTGPSAVRFADGPSKGQIKGVRRFTR
jgi:hypothetical protein